MRTKLILVILIIVAMTGTAVASDLTEQLVAGWTGTQIVAEAWDFKTSGHPPYWYQIRYYQPGTFELIGDQPKEIGVYSISNPGGYFIPNDPFLGFVPPSLDAYTSTHHYTETFHPDVDGEWTVALMKAGIYGSSHVYVRSLRGFYKIIVSTPSISLKKGASPGSYTGADKIITYTYEIKNTGTFALSGDFYVRDDHINSNAWFTCFSGTLEDGDTVSCSQTYTTTPGDVIAKKVINTAEAKFGSVYSNQEIKIIYYIGNGGGSPPGIPEFPTIALPVAAVLGILFIMQRRKKEE